MTETAHPRTAPLRARAEIDLAALRANVRALRAHAPTAALMAVVKSDAYGHGAVPCARAAREAGATWLGTATPEEALALRAAGIPGRIMCWLWTPGGPWAEAIEADLDVSVSGMWALREVTAAAEAVGAPARVQLKADTGLGRGGCQPADWPELVAAPSPPRPAASSPSPASGRTSPAPTSRGTPRSRPNSRCSARWWPTPSSRACAPRCGTSPTRPRR